MHTAIHHQRRIVSAQNKLLRRIRKELRTRIPNITIGFPGDHLPPQEVFANNRIWFAYQSLENKGVPRHWNAFGSGRPVLRRSNHITVEVNPAIHGVNRMVKGLFAVDEETGHTVLLHRGRLGGIKGIGKTPTFMEWYHGTKVDFFDPSHDDGEESAILVADLDSERFLIQLEDFVVAVDRFKASREADDPAGMSNAELTKKAATAPKKPKSYTRASVVYERRRDVAEYAKRRAAGKCELCGELAPFTNAFDDPFLESHHIVWLAHGGSDSIENTVALCPNCHRKMHVVRDAKDIRKLKRRAGKVLGG